MCGIAGIVTRDQVESFEGTLSAMLDTIAHRGPDDRGRWDDPRATCCLGHVRLSIIDLEGGHQPLGNEDGSIQIVFNGCIYNYQDLTRELRDKGHTFRTHSDTEAVVHAYEEWGVDCVRRFNGMWAFAIWDSAKQTLFCSRDRLGIKPFYYVGRGETFAFASEIKALLAGGFVDAAASADGLRQYLTFQFCLNSTTLFEGVHRLPPGHNMIVRPGRDPVVSQYWDCNFDLDETHDESWFVDRLAWLLEDSVRLRLRTDVSLGAHLSGGLDSTTVVCLAKMLLGESELRTFTGAFRDGQAFDETDYAKLVARHCGATYHETYLTAKDFEQSIERIIWHLDEPAAGPGVFPQYWVSKLASENVKVVLGGQGGDELFIGYVRYLVAYLEECLKGAIEDTASRANYVTTLASIVPSLPSLENYVPMLRHFWAEGLFEPPARRYYRLVDRFADCRGILHPDVAAGMDTDETFEEFEAIFDSHGAASKINRIFNFDVRTHLQSLLHVEDRTSMAWGLESRVPLLDHRLVEFICAVPPTIKFKNGRLKHMFARSIANAIPREILERKDKMGFPVPLHNWFGNELSDLTRDILLGKRSRERGLLDLPAVERQLASRKPFSRGLWGAISLEIWHRTFVDD